MIKLISSQSNVRYYSGFTGSIGILIIQDGSKTLIIDGRYTEQARSEVQKSIKVTRVPLGISLWDFALDIIKKFKSSSVGYEEDAVDVATFNKLKAKCPGIKTYSISGEIRRDRIVKGKKEIDLLSKAALIADLTYDCILHIIRSGLTELEISAHIDYLMKTFRAEAPAFETLVSSGALSSHPHGKPTEKAVHKGELIVLDFGARYKGYNSDITRMVSLGAPTRRQKTIYDAVLNAQEAAINKVKDGISSRLVDQAAREVLKKEKLAGYFTHGTGHGIGLQVHEAPRVSAKSKDILKEGMVITIEPGIYIPGFSGFRIEDMVLVTRSGCVLLTKSSKELKVIA